MGSPPSTLEGIHQTRQKTKRCSILDTPRYASVGDGIQDAEQYVRAIVGANPNSLISHYLIHSYLYYERNTNIVSDAFFTWICQEMVKRWDTLEHPHKWMVRVDVVRDAPSGFYLKKYPTIVKSSAVQMAEQFGAKLD